MTAVQNRLRELHEKMIEDLKRSSESSGRNARLRDAARLSRETFLREITIALPALLSPEWQASRWMPVSEKPDNDGWYLVVFSGGFQSTAKFAERRWWREGDEMFPSCWMPLPASPGATPPLTPGERRRDFIEREHRMESLKGLCSGDRLVGAGFDLEFQIEDDDEGHWLGDGISLPFPETFPLIGSLVGSGEAQIIRGAQYLRERSTPPTDKEASTNG